MTPMAQGRGRPLRFLGLVVVGWIGLRIALLWPQTGSLPEAIEAVFTPRTAPVTEKASAPMPVAAPTLPPMRRHADRFSPVPAIAASLSTPAIAEPPSTASIGIALVEGHAPAASQTLPAPIPSPLAPASSRWSGSAWLMARQGSGISTAPGGQIGGSQSGVRIVYALDRHRRIALFGRFVTPLSGAGREVTTGAEWRPGRAPIRLVAEYRVSVDSGQGAPGLGIVAGGELPAPGGFLIETYAQAGAIRRHRIEPYGDGAIRATRPIPGTGLSLGVGAWGAAQRDATRVDVGPTATLSLPILNQRLRIALDWRQRVAGDARPGSGLALTLGSDF